MRQGIWQINYRRPKILLKNSGKRNGFSVYTNDVLMILPVASNRWIASWWRRNPNWQGRQNKTKFWIKWNRNMPPNFANKKELWSHWESWMSRCMKRINCWETLPIMLIRMRALYMLTNSTKHPFQAALVTDKSNQVDFIREIPSLKGIRLEWPLNKSSNFSAILQ